MPRPTPRRLERRFFYGEIMLLRIGYMMNPRKAVRSGGAPVNTMPPVISGLPVSGGVLSVSDGAWTNDPAHFAYQWEKDGVAIPDATGPAYTVRTEDRGAAVSCTVTATGAGGSASAAAAATGIVANDLVWYDPSDPAAITSAEGSVMQVNDRSGNGNSLVQSSGSARPKTGTHTIGGRNALYFDGGDTLVFSTPVSRAEGYTIFAVARFDSDVVGGKFGRTLIGSVNGGPLLRMDTSRQIDLVKGGVSVFLSGSQAITLGQAYLLTGVMDVTDPHMSATWRDGTLMDTSANAPNLSADIRTIGQYDDSFARDFHHGLVGEVMIFLGPMTAADMNRVGAYLAAKWGMAWGGGD